MSSGTGVGFLDDIGNAFVQLHTGGLAGFGNDGLKKGVTTNAVIDGTKEITGAKAAEDANKMAREQFDANTAAAKQDRLNAQTADQRNQISASNAAGSARTNTGTKTNKASSVTGDVSDFLGL